MAKSKNRKKTITKKKNSTNNTKVINKEKNIKEKGPFMTLMDKNWARVILHLITAIIWILFLGDFFTFQMLEKLPNIVLSILALGTLILEWRVYKRNNIVE